MKTNPAPTLAERIAIREERCARCNEIIEFIASRGCHFFWHPKNKFARLEIDSAGRVWLREEFKGTLIYTHNAGRWRHFPHGSTLRSLICAMRNFIMRGEPGRFFLGATGEDPWAYGVENMNAIRLEALRLGLIPIVRSAAITAANSPSEGRTAAPSSAHPQRCGNCRFFEPKQHAGRASEVSGACTWSPYQALSLAWLYAGRPNMTIRTDDGQNCAAWERVNPPMPDQTREYIDFGFERAHSEHHFMVSIPESLSGRVQVTETFTGRSCRPKVEISHHKWARVAPELRANFNRRGNVYGVPAATWHAGENYVLACFGKELTLLLWAIENVDYAAIPRAIANWQQLAPEERWWLYTTINAASGNITHTHGWRKAIQIAFTENPVDSVPSYLAHRSVTGASPL